VDPVYGGLIPLERSVDQTERRCRGRRTALGVREDLLGLGGRLETLHQVIHRAEPLVEGLQNRVLLGA
jgi:hypothetical protein